MKKKETPIAPQPTSSLRIFVDHVSEGNARLLLGEDESATVTVPLAWLPTGTTEGMVLRTTLTIDLQASQSEKQQTQTLLDALQDNP